MPNNPSVMETAAQVIDTTSKRKGLVNAATIAHMIAMPKKIHAIFPAIYILPFYEKQSSTKITIIIIAPAVIFISLSPHQYQAQSF